MRLILRSFNEQERIVRACLAAVQSNGRETKSLSLTKD